MRKYFDDVFFYTLDVMFSMIWGIWLIQDVRAPDYSRGTVALDVAMLCIATFCMVRGAWKLRARLARSE